MSTNPFAPQPSHTPPADAPAASPFASSTSQGNLSDGFDLPVLPVGVLRGHITELAKYDKGYMLKVKCDDVNYPSKETVGIWIGTNLALLKQIASALGLVVEEHPAERKWTVRDENGNVGNDAFKNKPGLFVFVPRNDEPAINTFGLPKPGMSTYWDQYVEESGGLSDEQTKALKRARGGVVPGDAHHLFNT